MIMILSYKCQSFLCSNISIKHCQQQKRLPELVYIPHKYWIRVHVPLQLHMTEVHISARSGEMVSRHDIIKSVHRCKLPTITTGL